MIELTLPVYYTQEYKTKKDKTFLVGMNWYRNAVFFQQNLVKKHFQELVFNQLKDVNQIVLGEYEVEYTYFYKTATSDLGNVASMASKFVNDALQLKGFVDNDNVKYLTKETFIVGGQSKENPRVEIIIKTRNKE